MLLVGTPKSNEWFLFLIRLKEEPVTKKEAEKHKRDGISNWRRWNNQIWQVGVFL